MVDGTIDAVLLLELFTRDGTGTMVARYGYQLLENLISYILCSLLVPIMFLIGRQHDYLKTLTHAHVLACVHRHPDPFFCSEDFLNWLACLWTSELCFKGHQCGFDIAYVAS